MLLLCDGVELWFMVLLVLLCCVVCNGWVCVVVFGVGLGLVWVGLVDDVCRVVLFWCVCCGVGLLGRCVDVVFGMCGVLV